MNPDDDSTALRAGHGRRGRAAGRTISASVEVGIGLEAGDNPYYAYEC